MRCLGLKCRPPLVDTSGSGVLPCNFRNFPLLTSSCKISLSARIASAANHVWEDVVIFRTPTASPQNTLRCCITFYIKLCMICDVSGLLPSTFYTCFFYRIVWFVCLVICVCVFPMIYVLFEYLCRFYNRHLCS